MKVAIDGFSHPHVGYFLAELDHRPEQLRLVGAHPHPGDAFVPRDRLGAVPDFGDVRAMLDATRPDVLVVCGEYAGRADAVVAALDRGVDVLADKPLVVSGEGLDQVSRAAEASSALLSVAFEKRWYASTRQARALVASGAIGQVRQIQATGPHLLDEGARPPWYFDGRYGDILTDLPLHDIDLALLFSQATQGTISGWRLRRDDGFATACLVTIDLDGQASASLDANWLWPGGSQGTGRYQMRITGTEGVIYLDFARPEVELVTGSRDAVTERPPAMRPAQEYFDARCSGREPEVGTHASLAASRLAVLAARSASRGTVPQPWHLGSPIGSLKGVD
ncbi:Gfo/Idh/MocA family oxidoreductase [Brooklawnia cerclae]|uniref:Dehydrogenase n=1 Tax=Brooklawnia cerclae TaxID=349934 RepID=A0ABX0SLI8_9ACTN|nr:Gfo/Idh/MocA family oxidoreductase [Brooklawnia cerclae]NIH57900.1 putative dehydrogenase [Brooklawnia cerclae]